MLEDRGEIHWPDLSKRYDTALREAVAFVMQRFDIIGIVATGTIIRGTPDASSDLDIYVIHKAPVRQRIQKWFQGVPTEIFVNPATAVRRYFLQEHDDGRPYTAHMLSTGHVLVSRDPVIQSLQDEAAEWMKKPSVLSQKKLEMMRYAVATQYEDAVDVAARDPETAILLLNQSVVAMINYWYRSNGRFIPRGKDLLSSIQNGDSELAEVARRFFMADYEEKFPLAKLIAARTIGVEGFFEWESEPEEIGR